jgi:Tfp pilus assembly protein PilV
MVPGGPNRTMRKFNRRTWNGAARRLRLLANPEAGFALIEILVSSILVVILAVGVFTGFEVANRSTAEERHRTQAHGLAEQDLARMRSMTISDLSDLQLETRTVDVDGTSYTINSRTEYLTDATAGDSSGTQSCQQDKASADYIKIKSTVTWPSIGSRPPVVSASLVSPPSGSISPANGALAISVTNSQDVGIAGVTLSGTGPASFNNTTESNGCVIFGNLPEGDYTLSVAGLGSSLVDRNGQAPGSQTVSVVAQSTNTVSLQYDSPGSIPVSFTTKPYGASPLTQPVASSADSVIVFNSGLDAAKTFGTPGSPTPTITATSLFPFSSSYSVYAGTCLGDNPDPNSDGSGGAAIARPIVPPGASQAATIQLPALHLTVYSGSSFLSPGSAVSGATVTAADQNCPDIPTTGFQRTFTTNPSGRLADPGLPYSTYRVYARAVIGGITRCNYVRTAAPGNPIENVDVRNLSTGTLRNLYLRGPNAQTGSSCP